MRLFNPTANKGEEITKSGNIARLLERERRVLTARLFSLQTEGTSMAFDLNVVLGSNQTLEAGVRDNYYKHKRAKYSRQNDNLQIPKDYPTVKTHDSNKKSTEEFTNRSNLKVCIPIYTCTHGFHSMCTECSYRIFRPPESIWKDIQFQN